MTVTTHGTTHSTTRTSTVTLWACRGAVAAAAALLVTTGAPHPVASGSDSPPPVAGKRYGP